MDLDQLLYDYGIESVRADILFKLLKRISTKCCFGDMKLTRQKLVQDPLHIEAQIYELLFNIKPPKDLSQSQIKETKSFYTSKMVGVAVAKSFVFGANFKYLDYVPDGVCSDEVKNERAEKRAQK
jgi:hypothetical protein